MYRSGGDLSALSYCNYEDVMDVLLETIGRHSCSLEKDMGLQSPVYNLRILNVLKESYVWGNGVDITLDKVFIVFPTLLTRTLCPFNSDSPHAQIGVQSKKVNRKNISEGF